MFQIRQIVYLFILCLRYANTASILAYVNNIEFLKATKKIMTGFSPDKDLSLLQICHIFPSEKIYENLGDIFLDDHGILKSIHNLEIEKLKDFKTDIFKVHTDAAYLREADMGTRTKFYSLNANLQSQTESVINDLDRITEIPQEDYLKKLNILAALFFNAPANLRIAKHCQNNEGFSLDPSLKDYTGISHSTLGSFTMQSSFLADKYSLLIDKDVNGYIKTTDKMKNKRKEKTLDHDVEKNPDVFEMFHSR